MVFIAVALNDRDRRTTISLGRVSLLDTTLDDTALRVLKRQKTGGLAARFRKGSIWDSPTGRSAGLAPLWILMTYPADR